MDGELKTTRMTRRIGGCLREIVTVADAAGKAVHHVILSLMVDFEPRDAMQILVGVSILAVPVAFTGEAWSLGEKPPAINVASLSCLGMVLIATFVCFNFYRYHLKGHPLECGKRVVAIYLLSLAVGGVILTIIQRCLSGVDNILAIKRVAIVAFPASMSAAVSDTIQ